MNVDWNRTAFIFLEFIAAAFLLYGGVTNDDRNAKHSSITGAILALAAFIVTLMGINDPVKILTVLAAPTKGYSGAVIMQVIMMIAGVAAFTQVDKNRVVAKWVAIIPAIVAVIALSRVYMITTRPALNTYILTVLMALLVIQTSTLPSFSGDLKERSGQIIFGVSACYGVSVIAFIIHVNALTPQDRILDFARMTSGDIAPIFWGFVVLSFVIPFICALALAMQKKILDMRFTVIFNTVAIFLLSLLLTQLPYVARGVNNRIFF